ncbi:S-adenosyl-L-methionine-dependent methyltransferase [Hesseltinella vesiculosa]|uniref:S-adenosyl-L-methionine-dependent methyltransferase n=1 Tax=Hesseltinella vesiculosa TaxID=101127 RepID=A0A1X2GWK3_9FUNG|nr:S-adenosyl-L-methionine-dependent methyltransferase [Hesseltinella vesiculosa]
MTRKRLLQWQQSDLRHLCLDVRPQQEYLLDHLRTSVNIPLDHLPKRMAELPPKQQPFTLITHDHPDQDDAKQWLVGHGWQPRVVFRPRHELCFWPKAKALGCHGTGLRPATFLFRPHPLLQDHLGLLQDKLHNAEDPSDGGDVHVLDIGCGSGRDLTWLLNAHPTWQGTGIDALQGAQERFAWTTLPVRDRVQFLQIKIGATLALPRRYHLVLMMRCLIRPFLSGSLPNLVRPGGLVVLSHFVDQGDYLYPRKHLRLQPKELEQWALDFGFSLLVNRTDTTEDGRPTHSVILAKK